jgi:hypothetical protein
MLEGTRLEIAHPYPSAIKRFEIMFGESMAVILRNVVVYSTISGLYRSYEMKLALLCLIFLANTNFAT